MNAKERIARRVALELKDGDVVNLGIGLPTQVANYLAEDIQVTFQSENGFLGLGPLGEANEYLVNAGGQPCGMVPGAAMFDSCFSFALIRGGHVDVCVLGGLQVDELGNLANWVVPGKMVPGMGGPWIWLRERKTSLSPWSTALKTANRSFCIAVPIP